jgi:glutathione peroxidase
MRVLNRAFFIVPIIILFAAYFYPIISGVMGAAKSALGIGGDKPIVAVRSFYELSAKTNEGVVYPFEKLKGKVVVISNVASKCGLTDSMYKVLGTLAEKYGSSGFVVLGFPCGQFMGQEFKNPEETCTFVKGLMQKFNGVMEQKNFVLMEKVDVNGPETHPVFHFLKYNSPLYNEKKDVSGPISWNFGKFLVDKEGQVIKYYSPTDAQLEPDVQAALKGELKGDPVKPSKI